jgi:hypothetical protein
MYLPAALRCGGRPRLGVGAGGEVFTRQKSQVRSLSRPPAQTGSSVPSQGPQLPADGRQIASKPPAVGANRSERCPVQGIRRSSLTTCLQSRIGPLGHLRLHETAQVEVAVAVSVIVRWGLARTAVNGTVVARPARTTFVGPGGAGTSSPLGEARPGDGCLVGKGCRPAAGSVGF